MRHPAGACYAELGVLFIGVLAVFVLFIGVLAVFVLFIGVLACVCAFHSCAWHVFCAYGGWRPGWGTLTLVQEDF